MKIDKKNVKNIRQIVYIIIVIIIIVIGIIVIINNNKNKNIQNFGFIPVNNSNNNSYNNSQTYYLKNAPPDLISLTVLNYKFSKTRPPSMSKTDYNKEIKSASYFKQFFISLVESEGLVKILPESQIQQPFNNVFYIINYHGKDNLLKNNYIVVIKPYKTDIDIYVFKVNPSFWEKSLDILKKFIAKNAIK